MLYLIIDNSSDNILMSNAGHMWPIYKNSAAVEQLNNEASFPLGIQKEEYKDYMVKMKTGDKLILFSDGVSEAANSNEEFFDEELICKSLEKTNADFLTIYNDLKSFAGNSPQNDDLTLVEIERIS